MIVAAEWNIFHNGQGLPDKGMPLMTVYLTHLMEKRELGMVWVAWMRFFVLTTAHLAGPLRSSQSLIDSTDAKLSADPWEKAALIKTNYRTLTLQGQMNIRWCHELCCEYIDLGWLEYKLIWHQSKKQKSEKFQWVDGVQNNIRPPLTSNGTTDYFGQQQKKQSSYRFAMTLRWINKDRVFIFGWTIPAVSVKG